MNWSMTGTIKVVLILSSRIKSQDAAGSNAFMRVIDPPTKTDVITGVSAPTWNKVKHLGTCQSAAYLQWLNL